MASLEVVTNNHLALEHFLTGQARVHPTTNETCFDLTNSSVLMERGNKEFPNEPGSLMTLLKGEHPQHLKSIKKCSPHSDIVLSLVHSLAYCTFSTCQIFSSRIQ